MGLDSVGVLSFLSPSPQCGLNPALAELLSIRSFCEQRMPTEFMTRSVAVDWNLHLHGKEYSQGTRISEAGEIQAGTFYKNYAQGQGKITWINKKGSYEGNLAYGLPHGQGVHTDENGNVYNGTFAYGLFDGEGTYTWKDGLTYTGPFTKGEIDVLGKLYTYIQDAKDFSTSRYALLCWFVGIFGEIIQRRWGRA